MAKIKYREILTNPYDPDEQVEIQASTEELFKKRREEQYKKWDLQQDKLENEQYVQEQQQRAYELTVQLKQRTESLYRLCYSNLNPLSPDSYIDEKVAMIKLPRRRVPTLDEAEVDVGINKLVKIAGIVPGKSKDRLKKLQDEAHELYKARLEKYHQKIEDDKEIYRKEREKELVQLTNHIEGLKEGRKTASNYYFSYALDRDDYSVNTKDRFHPEHSSIQYFQSDGEIKFSYRIPNGDEILTAAKYEYDAKKDTIIAVSRDRKTASRWKLRIAESVMLRATAIIFLSDHYSKVNTVSITGYLRYHDSAFGNEQKKKVIRMTMTREIFDMLSLESLDPYDLFSRVLNATISSGLYSKEPFAISEIN